MTPAERTLWARLRRNQLDGLHFRRQQVIDGFIADFYCHAAGLVVELDGPVHDSQPEYDAERDRIFAGRGLCVLRFRNEAVYASMDEVLRAIAVTCRERIGQDPSPGPSPEKGGE
jgi:very-short-patch-repair endonuclease